MTLLMSTTAAAVIKARESSYLLALAANPTFVSGLVACAVARAAKAPLTSVIKQRWNLQRLFSPGGCRPRTLRCPPLSPPPSRSGIFLHLFLSPIHDLRFCRRQTILHLQ